MTLKPIINEASCAFVILTWNSIAYIERCIDSVLALPFGSLKVYVFDNGSEDGTPEYLAKQYSVEISDGRVTLIRSQRNLGTTRSRNTILKRIDSSTDYICILDSDTEVYAAAFKAMCEHYAADANAEIGVMGPRMRNEAGELQFSGRNLPNVGIKLGKAAPIRLLREAAASAEVCDTPVRAGLQDVGYLLSACWLMPFSTYKTVGQLDEDIFYAPEDVDWCVRVHKKGLRVVLAHDAEILHAYQRIGHKKLFTRTNASHAYGLVHYFIKNRYLFNSKTAWNPADALLDEEKYSEGHIC